MHYHLDMRLLQVNHNMFCDQGRRNVSRAGGAEKKLRAMQKNKKIFINFTKAKRK